MDSALAITSVAIAATAIVLFPLRALVHCLHATMPRKRKATWVALILATNVLGASAYAFIASGSKGVRRFAIGSLLGVALVGGSLFYRKEFADRIVTGAAFHEAYLALTGKTAAGRITGKGLDMRTRHAFAVMNSWGDEISIFLSEAPLSGREKDLFTRYRSVSETLNALYGIQTRGRLGTWAQLDLSLKPDRNGELDLAGAKLAWKSANSKSRWPKYKGLNRTSAQRLMKVSLRPEPGGERMILLTSKAPTGKSARLTFDLAVRAPVGQEPLHDGVLATYWNPGRLRTETTYRGGVRHGLSRSYYGGGELRFEESWSNGRLHGTRRGFNRDGALVSEEPFVQGKRHGVEVRYRADGSIAKRTRWRNGKKQPVGNAPDTKRKR